MGPAAVDDAEAGASRRRGPWRPRRLPGARAEVSARIAPPSITTKPRTPTIVCTTTPWSRSTASDEQADAGHEDHAAEDHPPAGGALERRAAQGGGELGVLLDEGALHLLEQSQFFLGELHGSSSPLAAKSRHAWGAYGRRPRKIHPDAGGFVVTPPTGLRPGHPDQARRPHGRRAEPTRRPVDRTVGLGPAVLGLPEHQLAVHGGAWHQPLHRTPTRRRRARCRPSAS